MTIKATTARTGELFLRSSKSEGGRAQPLRSFPTTEYAEYAEGRASERELAEDAKNPAWGDRSQKTQKPDASPQRTQEGTRRRFLVDLRAFRGNPGPVNYPFSWQQLLRPGQSLLPNHSLTLLLFVLTLTLTAPSAHAQLGIPTRPVIVEEPKDQTTTEGGSAAFKVVTSSFLRTTYQWQRNDRDQGWIDLEDDGRITGANTDRLRIEQLSTNDVTEYRARVSNPIGTRTSNPAGIGFPGAVEIIQQPVSQSVSLGPEVRFSVFANGSRPFSFQWYWNGKPLVGAVGSELVVATERMDDRLVEINIRGVPTEQVSLTDHLVGDAGTFRVEVKNGRTPTPKRSDPATLEIDATFTKVTDDPILASGGRGWWADYDTDGDWDLFSARGESLLYQNDGTGVFRPFHLFDGITESWVGTWGDYDNDGDPDLFVDDIGADALFRNDRNGSFVRTLSGVEQGRGRSLGASWADYDGDGHLDLFVAQGGLADPELNFLYHNLGNGRFESVGPWILLDEPAGSFAPAWADYDDDGDMDLFVGNREGKDFLYENNGDGHFVRITTGPVPDTEGDTVSASWADFDNDGDLDLVAGTVLYRNHPDRPDRFEQIPDFELADNKASWGDFDNDGDLDLFVGSGVRPNQLYRNDGNGGLQEIGSGSPSNDRGRSSVIAWVDINNDGFLDLFVDNYHPDRSLLYRNSGSANHWIRIKCQGGTKGLADQSSGQKGPFSNRDGIGVKIRTRAIIGGKEVSQLRQITGGDGNANAQTPDAHFGLGDATNIATLRVEWPSGIVQEFRDVQADQILAVTEPDWPVTILPSQEAVPLGANLIFNAHIDFADPVTYQWQKDGQDLPGETSSALSLQNIQATDYGRYTVLVEHSGLSARMGAQASLRRAEPPRILWQPQQQTPVIGGNVLFRLQATGSQPLRYQWQKRESEDADWIDIPGTDAPEFRVSAVTQLDVGDYRVLVSNDFGSLHSKPASLRLAGSPTIIRQPEDQSASPGATVAFTVDATGAPPLSYQWRKDGVDLPGATDQTLLLTAVSASDVGVYSVLLANGLGTRPSAQVVLEIDPTFAKIVNDPVVADGGGTGGVSWADFDGDGYLDLFLPNRASIWTPHQNRLYRNNRDGSFNRVEDSPISTDEGISGTGSWGDFDNDGDLDLFVANAVSGDFQPDFLYQNDGAGSFTKILGVLPVIDVNPGSAGSGWIDYDNDGWLDLFETSWSHGAFTTVGDNVLYRNTGDGSFSRVTDSPVVLDGLWSLGQGWADVDNDRDLDLFVGGFYLANFPEGFPGRFYINTGHGTFLERLDSPLVSPLANRLACAWGDYDNDGSVDLFVAADQFNFLYHNDGDGTFTRVIEGPVATDEAISSGGVWGDYDNDGWLDLFVANGPWATPASPNTLYHNEGHGQFTKIRKGSLVNEVEESTAAAWADYDRDGDLDLYVVNMVYLSNPETRPNSLFRNELAAVGNHWLKIKCKGTYANKSAIGSTIRVNATIAGGEVWQMRQIVGGDSWGSTSIFEAHFGLGDAEIIDTIRIEWPGPAFTTQELHNVPVDQFLTIVEPEVQLAAAWSDGLELSVQGGTKDTVWLIQVSPDLEQWEPLTSLTVTEPGATLRYTDPGSEALGQRFYRVRQPEAQP